MMTQANPARIARTRANLADSLGFAVADPLALIALFDDRAPESADKLWRSILASWDATFGFNAHLAWESSNAPMGAVRWYALTERDRSAPWV